VAWLALQSHVFGECLHNDFAVHRYNPDGSLDPNFGTDGIVITPVYAHRGERANAVAIQPDGKIVAAGHDGDFTLVRYLGDPLPNRDPVAVDDSASTVVDTGVTINVLANDSDPDGHSLTVTDVTDPANGFASNNGDGTVTYTPDADFEGQDVFDYTITDGNGGTATATVPIDVSAANANSLYVYDIRFESKRGGKDWRAVFEIRSDSNANGEGDAADAVAPGVEIRVEFAGQTYTGTTDSDGVFRTSWIKRLGSGDHYAEVVDLVLANYFWDPLTLDLEGDSDGDGLPDDVLYR